MRTIEIIINPAGQTTVQTRGFTGASCREASRLIEQALGKKLSDTPTPDMHQSTDTATHLQQRSGE